VRIAAFDAHSYLVADYTRKTLSWFGPSETLSPFIETLGKPLSIAINASFRKNGKLKEAYYFIGNDDDRTIDVYYEKNDQFYLTGQYPVVDNGIQALDMVFDQALNQLFVVDGLDQEIKVLQPDGQLVRSFGAVVLSDPKGIAIDLGAGEIYVTDYGDSRAGLSASIKVFDLEGGLQRTISGAFSRPQGLTLTSDKLFVTDNMLAQILEFDRTTNEKTASYGCQGSSNGHLLLPMDVVLDDAGLNFYVADNRNMRITVLPLTESQ
jgi:DNA-binding beta-propeller fold protein YncE